MQNINNNELTTIRIALMEKIDNMHEYIKDCEKYGNETGKLYWQEAIVKHRELLDKLYTLQIY